jgi:hypothetical protein
VSLIRLKGWIQISIQATKWRIRNNGDYYEDDRMQIVFGTMLLSDERCRGKGLPGSVLILTELHNMVDQVTQLQIRIPAVPATEKRLYSVNCS